MKILQKLLLILIIGACVFMVMPQNTVKADVSVDDAISNVDPNMGDGDLDGIQGIINKVIGFIQWASIIALVIVLVVKGWEYITGTPSIKDEVKKTAVPLLVGAVLVFGATTIAKFVLNTAKING